MTSREAMTSRDLTAEQVDRLIREADRQLNYYLRAWRRAQANDITLTDPLAQGINEAWQAISLYRDRLLRIKKSLPQPYRPLGTPTKTRGLREVDKPWARLQRDAAAEVEGHQRRTSPPDPAGTPPAAPTATPRADEGQVLTSPSQTTSWPSWRRTGGRTRSGTRVSVERDVSRDQPSSSSTPHIDASSHAARYTPSSLSPSTRAM